MRMIRKIHLGKLLIAVVFIALMPLVANASMDTSEINKSVIRIYNDLPRDPIKSSTGTGFVVNESGYVVTNYHVIDGSKNADGVAQLFMLEAIDGKVKATKRIKVIWSSKQKDIAIVKVEKFAAPALTLFSGKIIKGTDIFAVGFPGAADHWTTGLNENFIISSLTDGIISRVYKDAWPRKHEKITIIQHNAQVNHGNSGGPLLNTCKQVLGVNTQSASAKEHGSVTGVFFASDISNIIEALKENHIKFKSSSSCNPESDVLITQGLMMGGIALLMGLLFGRKKTRDVIIKEVTKYSRKSKIDGGHSHRAKSTWHLSIDANGWPKKTPLDSKQLSDPKGLIVGRDGNVSNCPLKDSSVSGRHCRLMLYQGSLYIEDLNSTNGTMVNGKTITPFQSVPVSNHDEILIGDLQATLVKSR